MDTKIQELTDKIYKEGVEKGNEEAGRIIAEANAQKDTILKDAEAEAKRIVAAAEKQAAELKKNTEAELKLFATQSVEALKSEVTNLITGDIASSNVKAALMDPAYMQKVILELVKSWPANEFLTIQASDSDGLKAYFEANAKGLLEKGYKIEKVGGTLPEDLDPVEQVMEDYVVLDSADDLTPDALKEGSVVAWPTADYYYVADYFGVNPEDVCAILAGIQ